MKVALVCPYDLGKAGGVQDQVFRIARWLRSSGHEAVVVGPGNTGPEDSILVGSTATIPANRASTPISLNPRIGRRLAEAVEDVDVVHIHEPLMPTVSLAATRFSHKPTVGTFHADAPGWARFGYSLAQPLTKAAIARLDVLTAVSDVARSSIAGINDVRIIPNGIDVDQYGVGDKTPSSVSFLGRDDPRKGLDILLSAWPLVVARVPEATLTVVGAARDEEIVGVTFAGRVSEEEKRLLLSQAEIYVAPNLGGESFGIVVAEGMASRCAVVASAIPAFVHVLGDSGTFVQPGDVAGLAQAIAGLLADPSRRWSLAEVGRERVGRFDRSTVVDSYLGAYEAAISRYRPLS
ncbi:MAG: glycosyltransferase family 4 protein [Acidimicrobiia bacterium]